jgi:N-ethylmaleimide reductase
MAAYYQQRASAGLIITEATQISPQGQGYSWTPGLHSAEQVEGWRLSTEAVHRAGGIIFSQLWHVGRMSYAGFHEDGKPVAPSALAPDAQVWVVDEQGKDIWLTARSRGHLSIPIFSRLLLIIGRPH